MDKLFLNVFKNKILCNLIFSKVHHIHSDIKGSYIYKWIDLLQNRNLLSYHNYLNEIKQQNYYIDLGTEDFDALMISICRGDSLDVLQYFINKQPELCKFKYKRNDDLLFYSVKYNSLRIFKYLESLSNSSNNNNDRDNIKKKIINKFISFINFGNNIPNVEWDYYHALSIVPSTGNIEIFLYLLDKVDIRGTLINKIDCKNEYPYLIETIESSAENGRTEMLDHIFSFFKSDKYLLDEILKDYIPSIIPRIIRKCGQLYILKQYFNNIIIQDKLKDIHLILKCAKHNRFEMMKYFHENQLGKNHCVRAIDKAATSGNLDIIKWLHHNRTDGCTFNAMNYAAENGHFEIIKWLHHNRTEGCTTNAMEYAARSGHFEIVKWLHHNRTEGCRVYAMDYAAANGHLEIVKWLHENRSEGCTFYAMHYAAFYGHLEMVKWLHFNRTEGHSTKTIDFALQNGHIDVVNCLRELNPITT